MRPRTVLVAVAIWLAATLFFTASQMAQYLGTDKSYAVLLHSNALRYGIWTLLSPVIATLTARWPLVGGGPLRQAPTRVLALLGLALILTPLVSVTTQSLLYYGSASVRHWAGSLERLLELQIWNSMHGDFLIAIVLITAFQGTRLWRDLQAEQRRASDLERQLAAAQLDALRMQLHPHFLFNTFHTITALIGEDPVTARRMMVALGDLLRRTLREPATPLQSLASELELIDLYMGIQALRLGARVRVDYDIEREATTAEVPHLVLQPLFENAVRHGAARLAGPCAIVFRAERTGARLHMRLDNDAPPSGSGGVVHEPGAPPRHGVGLANTLGRLRLHYGDDFSFTYDERPSGGVRVALSLPYRPTAAETPHAHAPALAGLAD
jgi:sensor histidine kinase YesM